CRRASRRRDLSAHVPHRELLPEPGQGLVLSGSDGGVPRAGARRPLSRAAAAEPVRLFDVSGELSRGTVLADRTASDALAVRRSPRSTFSRSGSSRTIDSAALPASPRSPA